MVVVFFLSQAFTIKLCDRIRTCLFFCLVKTNGYFICQQHKRYQCSANTSIKKSRDIAKTCIISIQSVLSLVVYTTKKQISDLVFVVLYSRSFLCLLVAEVALFRFHSSERRRNHYIVAYLFR